MSYYLEHLLNANEKSYKSYYHPMPYGYKIINKINKN